MRLHVLIFEQLLEALVGFWILGDGFPARFGFGLHVAAAASAERDKGCALFHFIGRQRLVVDEGNDGRRFGFGLARCGGCAFRRCRYSRTFGCGALGQPQVRCAAGAGSATGAALPAAAVF